MDRLVVVAVLVATGVVRAYAAPSDKPWAINVSDAEQTVALGIYKAGNADFEEARYAQALAKYREAIKHWDHPAIRFNMAVCLINLDQLVEADDDLELALKYGDAALGVDVFAQGLTYRKLLGGQLAQLEVVTTQPGVELTLDGKHLMGSAAHAVLRTTPGDHQLVATKSGYLTQTVAITLPPGKLTQQQVTLVDLAAATQTVRRWAVWKPWALLSGGMVVGLVGGELEHLASRSYADYDAAFEPGGVCAQGCGGTGEPPLPHAGSTARIENASAISLFALGGAMFATGVVGVFFNQPRAVVRNETDLHVSPVVGPGAASLVIDGRF